jgi:23S rRNA (cytidine2498-2'-O)-methyltransferase
VVKESFQKVGKALAVGGLAPQSVFSRPPTMTNPLPPMMTSWLIRIPEVFADVRGEVFSAMGCEVGKELGVYQMIRLPAGVSPRQGPVGIFISWCLPLDHAWPCDPGKMDGFIEKAATALQRKFLGQKLRTVWVGTLQPGPGDAWYKRMASNLRGRALQLFPDAAVPLVEAGDQDPDEPALFCLVGRQGLYAGLVSPRACNGFYPGGVRYLPKSSEKTISRAGAKVAEALHHAKLFGDPPGRDAHWLELGASPGGMTSELLGRGARVTAIDRAPLDERLYGAKGLTFLRQDVAAFQAAAGVVFDALLCDMNDDPRAAFAHVLRLSAFLRNEAWIIFTLKTAGSESFHEIVELHDQIRAKAKDGGLQHLGTSHLSGNRREFTMWFLRQCG